MRTIKLRPYQIEDVEKLTTLPSMGCFNEPRTGKTPTAIHVMKRFGVNKTLVICPASAIPAWVKEYKVWSDYTTIIAYTGTPKQRAKLLEQWTSGVLIASYGTLKETQTKDSEIEKVLAKNPQGLIVDEAHRIKDPRSAQAKMVFKCHKIPHRLPLTGTPAPRKQHEIFSILKVIDPATYTSYWNFIYRYFEVSTGYGAGGRTFKEIGPLKASEKQEFLERLACLTTQRKRKDVMPWLPPKDYQKVFLLPSASQQKHLDNLSLYYETEHVTVQGNLDRLIRYRQICAHPALLDLKGTSPKMDWLLNYITDYPDRPSLVFSKFTSFINLLQKKLERNKKVAFITGATPVLERGRIVQAFQDGKLNMLIMNIDACKENLTLDRAVASIFLDKFPPIADMQQAEDRFVATTPEKANKAHTIYEVVLEGTYDEEIYKALDKQLQEVDVINNYAKYMRGEKL